MTEKLTTLVITDVFLPRRGKGKGVQQTRCFGIPVYPENSPVGTAAIEVNIKPIVDSFQLGVIIDAIEAQSGLTQELIKTGVINGINEMIRSESTQAKVEFEALVDYIKQEDLHRDDADALMLAKAFQTNQRLFKEGMAQEQSLQDWTDNRKRWIEVQVTKGLWRAKLVGCALPPSTPVETVVTSEVTPVVSPAVS